MKGHTDIPLQQVALSLTRVHDQCMLLTEKSPARALVCAHSVAVQLHYKPLLVRMSTVPMGSPAIPPT